MPVYFAQDSDGLVKIGTSGDVRARLKQLESEHGSSLSLLKVIPGSRAEELEYHERFADHRIDRTEWFRPGPDLVEFCSTAILVDHDPNAIEVTPTTFSRVHVDMTIVAQAKIVASSRSVSLAEYLTGLLRSPVDRDYMKVVRDLEPKGGEA